MPGAPDRAIVLARISEARNGDTHGVDGQIPALREVAGRISWTIGPDATHVIIENDTSAYKRRIVAMPDGRREKRPYRPRFWEALAMLRDGRADGLIAIDLDRACRDPRDLEDLIDVVESRVPRIPVESVTGTLRLLTTSDISMARMLVAVANKSSADTARRVAAAHHRNAAAGKYRGGRRRYGWETDGITPRRFEQEIIRWASESVLAGVSLRYLVRYLTEHHVPTVTGTDWSTATLRGILMRPSNAGISIYTDPDTGERHEFAATEWEPILPEDQWRAVCAILGDPGRRTNEGRGNKPRWLGSLIYQCGRCEREKRPLVDSQGRSYIKVSGGRPDAPTYQCCAAAKGTSHLRRVAGPVDDFVARVVCARLARPDAADLITPPGPGIDAAGLRKEAAALRELLDEQARLHARRVIDDRQLEAGSVELRAELDKVSAQLAAATAESPLAPIAGRADAAKVWDDLDRGRQREIVKALVTVTLLPVEKLSGRVFGEDTVRIEWKTDLDR